ncbi:MAG TPA: hypothetical protein PK156_22120 [Polyangium sp.]|nr:hypothetical protein [Polyangium sp.]
MKNYKIERVAFHFASLVFGALMAFADDSHAYPTAVVFAPTGDVKGPGDTGAFLYQAMYFKPVVGAGPAWLGMDVGVLPRVPYGDSGLSFGGLEIGIDAFAADLYGTPSAFVKPIFNAKLQVLTEGKWIPNLALGAMQIDPFRMNRSMNMVYGSMTKTLEFSGTNYGRLTLGFGGALVNPGDDVYRDTYPVFYATAPFPKDSKLLLIAGYESPAFGPFNIAVDHIGGYSEVSSTNVVANFTPVNGATLGLGGFFGSDPNAFYAGMFAYIFVSFNVFNVFGKKDEPAAAAPAPAPTPAPVASPTPATAPPATPATPPSAAPAATETQPPADPHTQPTPETPQSISAPGVSKEKQAACEAECVTQSEKCSNGCPAGEDGRGCLRKCGCARVSCDKNCSTTGEADFRCH